MLVRMVLTPGTTLNFVLFAAIDFKTPMYLDAALYHKSERSWRVAFWSYIFRSITGRRFSSK
jgi:hypothetical protein